MEKLSMLEEKIYNEGERLIPGVTHDIFELIRHKSSYVFFKKVIEYDLESGRVSRPVRIVDLGCGVGHGCYTLSGIPDSHVLGVDISPESLEYAQAHYSKPNISYQLVDLKEYISVMPEFDYVVSRHAFEHIPNGLELAISTKWRNRVLFEVPYDEPEGNPHHVLLGIREEHFSCFPDAELFSQDLDGMIYDLQNKPLKPNGIICIYARSDLPRVGNGNISFPSPAWEPEDLMFRELIWHHKKLQQEHQALQQTRAVVFARTLAEYPPLMKLAETGYGFLAKIYHWFGGR